MSNNKNFYKYLFENGESHTMTPLDAYRYSAKKKLKIVKGPEYRAREICSFKGWGWHDGLKMNFSGPKHYREYLKIHGIEEWGDSRAPQYKEIEPPLWDDAMFKKCALMGIEIGTVMERALRAGTIQFPGQEIESSS